MNQRMTFEESMDQYETLNQRVSEVVIESRILHVREDGIWEWK
ncbi:hypothetical protein [Fodinisporobacter ferrooxydans]